jgi:hypothetical protein
MNRNKKIMGTVIKNNKPESIKKTLIIRMVFFSFLLILVLFISYEVNAKPTSSNDNIVTNTKDAVFNSDIYSDHFVDIYDYYKVDDNSISITMFSGTYVDIHAGNSATDPLALGKNYIRTRELLYKRVQSPTEQSYFPLYTITARFTPLGTSYHTFRIIDNDDVAIYLNGNLELYAYDKDTPKYLCTLVQNNDYTIYVEEWATTLYDVHIDTNQDGNWDINEPNIRNCQDVRALNAFWFGDYGGGGGQAEDWGEGLIDYFVLKGHWTSNVKFFETFNDGNANNWLLRSEDGVGQIKPDGIYLTDTNDGEGPYQDYALEMHDQGEFSKTRAYSPNLDIVSNVVAGSSTDYSISLDFYARRNTGTNYHWFILLSDNDEIVLFLNNDASGNLCLWSYSGTPANPPNPPNTIETKIMQITPNRWYFLKVDRSDNCYKLYIDQNFVQNCNFYQSVLTPRLLRFGDFLGSDYFDMVKLDNIMFCQQRDLGQFDSDNDEFSDSFEADPNIPILYEDFEYDFNKNYQTESGENMEEYGWQHVILNNKGNINIWEIGYPIPGMGDIDNGITFGQIKNPQGYDKQSMVLGTNIGGNYPAMDMWLKSPIIDVVPKGNSHDKIITIAVSLWTRYAFENGDGGAVYLEYGDRFTDDSPNIPIPFLLVPTDNSYQNVPVLPDHSGYGASSGWKYQVYRYQSGNPITMTFLKTEGIWFRICFRMVTDEDGQFNYGWYIDNLKVSISLDTNPVLDETDCDNDAIPNGQEFYDFKTCPVSTDTDFDGITDSREKSKTFAYFGKEYGGDFFVKNLFVEIDYLFGNYIDTQTPSYSNFDLLESDCALHQIVPCIQIQQGIYAAEAYRNMNIDDVRTHFTNNGYFTPGREETWYYCVFAHLYDNGGVWGESDGGNTYAVFRQEIQDSLVYPWLDYTEDEFYGFVVAHEQGHGFGLDDYNSLNPYNGGSPPPSTMDANPLLLGARTTYSMDEYLKGSCYTFFDCQVDHTGDDDYGWGDTTWRYGGWYLNHANTNWCHDAEEGEWYGGIRLGSGL